MSKCWRIGVYMVGCVFAWVHLGSAGGPSEQFAVSPLPGQVGATVSKEAESALTSGPAYAPGELLVQFRKEADQRVAASLHTRLGATVVKDFSAVEGLQRIRLPQGVSVQEALMRYQQQPDVVYAEPNFRVRVMRTPNDPFFNTLWGLHNTGQTGGTFDADVDVEEAWELSRGSNEIVVAVIDTGIDYTHADLATNLWRNTADCNSNGLDDDGNGYADDCYGLDTANDDADPMDDHSHGTHVAGTIGAVGHNGLGVVGVAWRVRLMACKFLNSFGYGYTADAIACLQYVQAMKDRGVNIVATNNSWAGGEYSRALRAAIAAHRERGILFIAAAGNWALDNATFPIYPANYDLANVIAVAATDRFDHLTSFSNYGRHTVHLAAPGDLILSTVPGNTYAMYSGTSMAAPHVCPSDGHA